MFILQCNSCPLGYATPSSGISGSDQCIVCDVGYYMSSGGVCTECPVWYTTPTTGATSISQCGKPIVTITLFLSFNHHHVIISANCDVKMQTYSMHDYHPNITKITYQRRSIVVE